MKLVCGQKVVVREPDTKTYINGQIMSFFYLTEDDVQWLRRRNPIWAHVRTGDRAFHYHELSNDAKRDFTTRVFVLGYEEIYLCMR
jgi:hypothetical protein